ncbi:KOW domain-containing RNA-binding protein [Tumebacillus algifaecis]|uniref:KOW domain-containing RNA-binding protein n=1 Tax=Tumebacillus algifaecis TaxID=1214604 RepID=UPI0018803F4A|nr:KOW domain-containing RNA-binding protein [Tumebacillus algifaecis]
MPHPTRPHLGQIVLVTQGKEAGNYCVIVGIHGPKFVLLADGAKRKSDAPKHKNIAHVQLLAHIDEAVAMKLEQQGQVQNALLRCSLNRFKRSLEHIYEEAKRGSDLSGER